MCVLIKDLIIIIKKKKKKHDPWQLIEKTNFPIRMSGDTGCTFISHCMLFIIVNPFFPHFSHFGGLF